MTSNAQKQTVEMFGYRIEYDPSKNYGLFNSQGQYGRMLAEITLPKMAQRGDKVQLLRFLDAQVEHLTAVRDNHAMLEASIDAGILQVTSPRSTDTVTAITTRKEELQNTIDLFQYMVHTLNSL